MKPFSLLTRWPRVARHALKPVETLARLAGAAPPPTGSPLPVDRDQLLPMSTLKVNATHDLAPAALKAQYDALRARASILAGRPGDVPQRAMLMDQIYRDSKGNHAFPLVALHGALWAKNYFQLADEAVPVLGAFSNRQELEQFDLAMQSANRSVFVDTYTNYYFTKLFGEQAGAEQFVDPTLLEKLRAMHRATGEGQTLTPEAKRALFEAALNAEQERTVAPAVDKAAADFHDELIQKMAFAQAIHFAYFGPTEELLIPHFEKREERVAAAMKAFDLAQKHGWDKVDASISGYHVLPKEFFADRQAYVAALEERLLAGKPD
jgi:hypothetical protein